MEFSFDREVFVFMNSDREVSACMNSNFKREERKTPPPLYVFSKSNFKP